MGQRIAARDVPRRDRRQNQAVIQPEILTSPTTPPLHSPCQVAAERYLVAKQHRTRGRDDLSHEARGPSHPLGAFGLD
jgi:hypothetical protein